MIPHKKCNKSYSKHFFVKCTVFCMKGVKGFKKCDFAGDVKFLLFIRFWWGFLHLFFRKWFLMKKLTKCTTFEDNMSQNNLLSSHITVSSILLCPALYCVQHIIVSNNILCPHLPKVSFVHLSHFNVLRSYHAALAKHLCY